MSFDQDFKKKSYAIYGLGLTGHSTLNFLKKSGVKNFFLWDDNSKKRKNFKVKYDRQFFKKKLNKVNYIIISPGININKSFFKKNLNKNFIKILTDIDLFFLKNDKKLIKSIVVTGTNGKSTFCKILEHILKKKGLDVKSGGNIGYPILDLRTKKKTIVIIEASSFQLALSKFIKPNYAILLNITNDHLDWHGSTKNYYNSKFKIFSNQGSNNFAFLNNKMLAKKFKKNKYQSKLKFINIQKYKKLKSKLKNDYLNSETNFENMSYVYALSKALKIKEKSFIQSLKSFKGLAHRHEIFYKKNNKIFINDSKATSFEASKFALKGNKNIFWILGGLPKKGDKFNLKEIRKNIIKAYIIGRNMNFFKNFLNKKVNFKLCKTLDNAILSIFKDIKKIKDKKITILFSPASASYDQFKNFEERGNYFKKLIFKKFKLNA